MAENFFTGFARGFEQSSRAREAREERDLSSRLSIFSSQYSDYQKAQDEDRERLQQAKALAKVHQGQFSDTANFDVKRLERTAYDMLSAGYDSKYIGEQFARGTFSELQNMNVAVDPLDDATTATGANIPTLSEGEGQEIDSAMSATSQQMSSLGIDQDDLWERVLTTESNNNHLQPDGSLTTSSKGALGIAQVMPKTAMQPGNNVPTIFDMAREMGIAVGAETEDVAKELLANKELNEKFGRAYFDAMQTRFGNDPVKTLIAYNAGPDVAESYEGDRSILPAETQGYLVKNLGLVDSIDPAQAQETSQSVPEEENEPEGLMTRISGGFRSFAENMAMKSEERVNKRFMEATGMTEDQIAQIRRGYNPQGEMSIAAQYFLDKNNAPVRSYSFKSYVEPEKLPKWQRLDQVTTANYEALAAEAEANNDPVQASSIRRLGLDLVEGDNFLTTDGLSEDNVALRINQLDRAFSNGEIDQPRYDRLKSDFQQFQTTITFGDPNDLLDGLNAENVQNRMLLLDAGNWQESDQLEGVRNAVFDFYIETFEKPDTGDLSYESLDKTLLRYDTEIAAYKGKGMPATAASLEESRDFFVEKIQPVYEKRLQEAGIRRKTAVEDMTEVDLLAALSGMAENDPLRPAMEARLDAFEEARTSQAVSEASLTSSREDPQTKQIVVRDGPDGNLRVVLGVRAGVDDTGRSQYNLPEGFEGERVRDVMEDEFDDFQTAFGNINTDERNYTTQRAAVSSLLDPTADILEILNNNPDAMALGGAIEGSLLNLITNITSVGNTFTSDLFNQEAQQLGLFEGLGTTNVLGINLDRLRQEGSDAALIRAKILLMAYKVGAAEGQTGQGMSNKDADRFRTIIRSSSDPAAFRRNLVDYVESKIDEVDTAAASIQDHPAVKSFNTNYPDSPYSKDFQKAPAREFYASNASERWDRYSALSTGAAVADAGSSSTAGSSETAAYDPDTVYTFSLEELNANRRNPAFAGARFFITQEMIDAGLFNQSQLGGQQRFKAP